MSIERIVKDNPSFHGWSAGKTANFGASDEVLKYMDGTSCPGFFTQETGSGKSTFGFLLADCKHMAIPPIQTKRSASGITAAKTIYPTILHRKKN